MEDTSALVRKLDELFESSPVVKRVEINKDGMARVEMPEAAFEDEAEDVPMLIPERVIFQPPATIVYWPDGDKTVVRCENDEFSEEFGYAMACMRKIYGSRAAFKAMFKDAYRPALKEKKKKKKNAPALPASSETSTLDGQIRDLANE